MTRISHTQLFALIVAFEVGSTTLFALGIGAKQNAWIVIIVAYIIGLGLLWVFTQIPKYYPHRTFSEILNETLGKPLAKPLILLFSLYFLHQTTHNFYEFGALIKMTALANTPLIVILYFFIFAIIYILSLGIEVLGRTVEIFLPYIIFFMVVIAILNMFSGEFELQNLRPVLNDIPSIMGEVPRVIAFPYGETVVFLTLWHFIRQQSAIRKSTYWAVGLSTFLLILSLIQIIAVLGAELASRTEIPLLETLLSINIAEIITNLDSIGVFLMFIGGFYKTAVHFLGFSLAMVWFFERHNPNWVIRIGGILLPLFSMYRFSSLDDQRWKGFETGVYVILIYSFIPILLMLILHLKNKTMKRKESHQ
ncbi:GerAB/ArcD/ProY family transporter [Gracilibacillus sp. YIM 98692]|uniref:GerAB/ArcD/ProY family transporter n=1 Tax=Gracilibacillus sp. YIM 98692 TaxID=2663532 RepID=UPI0013D8823A|nr:GerAB/ArcD/ProY family transporter [Gracilibacillus sp. YIM 98692]